MSRPAVASATVLLLAAAATAVVWPDQGPVEASPARAAPTVRVETSPVPMRVEPISRSAARVRLEQKPLKATGHRYAVEAVHIRARPTAESRRVGLLEWAEKVGVTGTSKGEWAEVVIGGESRWVHGDFLSRTKPRPEPEPRPHPRPEPERAPEPGRQPPSSPAPDPVAAPEPAPKPAPREPSGLSTAPCPSGSGVESGLTANAVAVHRAVCAVFPQVTGYGGLRPGDDGAHGSGRALDLMVSGPAGDRVAEWVRAHASALGVSEVIWSQRIWTVERSSEGWRWMEDRGSTTANHYDHVHVTVY